MVKGRQEVKRNGWDAVVLWCVGFCGLGSIKHCGGGGGSNWFCPSYSVDV